MRRNLYTIFLCSMLITSYGTTFAASKFEIAGWLPYWKKDDAASSTLQHLDTVTQISPFSYEVTSEGTLKNPMKTDQEPWTTLFAAARKQKVQIIPSILWNDRAAMENVLNSKTKRTKQITAIIDEVKKNKWDGIDIDYEGKSAETREGFSLFLTDLSKALAKNNKKLICTIEARTPVDSRYATVTPELLKKIEYSNNYKVIGRVCTQVRIMTYDQLGDDLTLTKSNQTNLYRPISDITWVKKVLTLALEDIPAKKIIVGLATYGYKYEIIPATATTSLSYSRIGAMNYFYANELATSLHIVPTRNSAGELSFTYATSTDASNSIPGSMKQYLIWYSDAEAIYDKVKIAKLYGLGGVAIFKLDGAYDPALWAKLK